MPHLRARAHRIQTLPNLVLAVVQQPPLRLRYPVSVPTLLASARGRGRQ